MPSLLLLKGSDLVGSSRFGISPFLQSASPQLASTLRVSSGEFLVFSS